MLDTKFTKHLIS